MYIGALPPASNRGAYHQDFQLIDDETDEGLDLTGSAIMLEIRKAGRSSAELSATISNGRIVLNDEAGVFALTLPADDMRRLAPMTYEAGITVTQNDETTQYFIGTLPVLDGIVG